MTSCKTQNTQSTSPQNNDITIGFGKTVKIPDSKISLQFKSIAEDSRCPVGATCVWEGVAIINMQARSNNEIKDFQIATRDFEPKNALRSVEYNGYVFTLTDVNPKRGEKSQTESSITIHYEKAGE